ncbi:MAG: DUF5309 domain-containing protein [Bacillota bacterium]
MSIPTNTYKTYEAVGIREDLSDVITNISPVDTQFYSAIGEVKATNTKHEWQKDSLAAAASNAQLEGDDRPASAVTPTVRESNNTQIQAKTFRISRTMEKVVSAGRKDEIAHQTTKAAQELAKDIEYAFLREVKVDGNATTARKMRGALNWITSNLDKASDATLNADGTITGGTARALTESIVKGVCQNIFVEGGNPNIVFCGAFQKRKFSEFAGSGNYRTIVENKKLEATVDVYVNDFYSLTIKPHRIMPTDVVVILDLNYWKKATLDPVARTELAKTGDSRIFDITIEHTLEARAEKANGRITNLTTS